MNALYKIKLQNFEGPLDLLLFFVRKDELNIYDIPIARITKSYLEYLQLMQDLNLDIASEFILMAATLMRIKVKMMLPKDPVAEDEEEMMDPREELSRRLIEYRQFKEASKSLSELDEYWRQVYRRSYFNFDLLPQNEEEAVGLKDVSFFDLLAAYKRALEKKPIPVFHNVERLNVTVEDQQKYIMAFFRDRNCYLFTELCDDMAKIEIVVTFLALLDLVKRAEIAIKQASIFDDIWIYKASEFMEEEIPESERADSEIQPLTETLNDTDMLTGQDIKSEPDIQVLDETVSETPKVVEPFYQPEIDEREVHSEVTNIVETPAEIKEETEPTKKSDAMTHEPDTALTKSEGAETMATEPQMMNIAPEYVSNEITLQQNFPVDETLDEVVKYVEMLEEGWIQTTATITETKQDDSRASETMNSSNPLEVTDKQSEISESPEIAMRENEKEKIEPAVETVNSADSTDQKDAVDAALIIAEVKNEEPAVAEVKPLNKEKISGWKNFLNKIVSFVRKIFSK
jgi:segregation and condensation protein A